MGLVAEILGIWTALAVVAGALIGRAISAPAVRVAPPPLLPRTRAISAAAAGSAVAAFGVFALEAPTLGEGDGARRAVTVAGLVAAPVSPAVAAPRVPTGAIRVLRADGRVRVIRAPAAGRRRRAASARSAATLLAAARGPRGASAPADPGPRATAARVPGRRSPAVATTAAGRPAGAGTGGAEPAAAAAPGGDRPSRPALLPPYRRPVDRPAAPLPIHLPVGRGGLGG